MNEEQLCDKIDEMWERYRNEAWLAFHVSNGSAGKELRTMAVFELSGQTRAVTEHLTLLRRSYA